VPYTKYISIADIGKEDLKNSKNEIFFLRHEPPSTPYIKLKIRIVEFEPNYDFQRAKRSFFQKLRVTFKKAFKTFKENCR